MKVAPVAPVGIKRPPYTVARSEYFFVTMFMPQDADWVWLRSYWRMADAIISVDTMLNAAAVWHALPCGTIRLAYSNEAARALLFTDGIVDAVCGRFVDITI